MKYNNFLFWNCDTQVDLVSNKETHDITQFNNTLTTLEEITLFTRQHSITTINTMDSHYINSEEFSNTPDYNNTFPEHCIDGSKGARFIRQTEPQKTITFEWTTSYALPIQIYLKSSNSVVIKKNHLSPFEMPNNLTENILNHFSPKHLFIYGVAEGNRIAIAAKKMVELGYKVTIFADAVLGDLNRDELSGLGVKIHRFVTLFNQEKREQIQKLFNTGVDRYRERNIEERKENSGATASGWKH